MQVQVIAPSVGAVVDGRPSRAEYFARVEFAFRVGDWSALPVQPLVLSVFEEYRCRSCAGKGIVRRKSLGPLRPCACCPSGADFDLPRREVTREEFKSNFGMVEAGFMTTWDRCFSCDITPIQTIYLSQLAAYLPAGMPWRPDCSDCGDTGWEFVSRQAVSRSDFWDF